MIDLKPGVRIQLEDSKEAFIIDKVFDDGHVDMTATKPYHAELMPDYYEKLYSVLLRKYKIIKS
jgi:hypothetical protein